MQRFRVECNFGSKYFDDIFNLRIFAFFEVRIILER